MKGVHIKMDEKTLEIIKQNAARQGIQHTRYIRSLIEKGLVIDHQIQAGNVQNLDSKNTALLSEKILEIALENVMLTRKLIRHSVDSPEAYSDILKAAMEGAKQYVSTVMAKLLS